MMAKYIFVLALLVFCYYWWRKAQAPRPRRNHQEKRDTAESMVRCAVCGVHVPASQALSAAGKSYCCAQHLERAEP